MFEFAGGVSLLLTLLRHFSLWSPPHSDDRPKFTPRVNWRQRILLHQLFILIFLYYLYHRVLSRDIFFTRFIQWYNDKYIILCIKIKLISVHYNVSRFRFSCFVSFKILTLNVVKAYLSSIGKSNGQHIWQMYDRKQRVSKETTNIPNPIRHVRTVDTIIVVLI